MRRPVKRKRSDPAVPAAADAELPPYADRAVDSAAAAHFERHYTELQTGVPPGEHAKYLRILRQPLPLSFRVTKKAERDQSPAMRRLNELIDAPWELSNGRRVPASTMFAT